MLEGGFEPRQREREERRRERETGNRHRRRGRPDPTGNNKPIVLCAYLIFIGSFISDISYLSSVCVHITGSIKAKK